jgi:16S rRNA (uracil1498-N3)-methyltransferase
MRIPRLYFPHPLQAPSEIILEEDAHHYLQQVLRLRLHAKIILFNGEGGEYRGEYVAQNRRNSVVQLTEFLARECESPLQIHLGQGLCKPDRMEWVLQKAAELGVFSITPLLTEYGNYNLSDEKVEKRTQRWQRILASACEQCERNRLPILNCPVAITQWEPSCDLKIFCHPALKSADTGIQKVDSLAVAIGAEGGFSDPEVDHLLNENFQTLALGPRILRTETAAVAALTLLQMKYGDLS